jgi:hypothetical protein
MSSSPSKPGQIAQPGDGVGNRAPPAGPAESAAGEPPLWWTRRRHYQARARGASRRRRPACGARRGLRRADGPLLGERRRPGRAGGRLRRGAGAPWLVRAGAGSPPSTCRTAAAGRPGRLDRRAGTGSPRLVQADAQALPFRDESFDVVVSALGRALRRRLAGTVRRWRGSFGRRPVVFSVTHPTRWAFPTTRDRAADRPSSYFDRTRTSSWTSRGGQLRRAPPHARGPGARAGRRRAGARGPGRAGVAGGHTASGGSGARCAAG